MKCAEAARLLRALIDRPPGTEGLDLDPGTEAGVRPLLEAGYLVRVPRSIGDPALLPRLQERFADVQARAAALRRNIEDQESLRGSRFTRRDESLAALERLDAEAREVRTQILDLADRAAVAGGSVEVSGDRLAVSYRGRELLATLIPRLGRAESMDLLEFEGELDRARAAFDARAQQAARILRIVSPMFFEVDEIHCRAASVGLAIRKEEASEVARAFAQGMEALKLGGAPRVPPDQRAVIAETMVLSQREIDKDSVQGAVREFLELRSWIAGSGPVAPSQVNRCALVLFPHAPERRREVLDRAWDFHRRISERLPAHPSNLTAAVLVAGVAGEEATQLEPLFVGYCSGMPAKAEATGEAPLASALLALAGGSDPTAAIGRFQAARTYLARFSENGMDVPAAMLAVQSPEIEEALDNLRLASAAISRHKLSLGGMENLSLGMKLLMETAIAPGAAEGIRTPSVELAPGPAPLGGIGIVGLAASAPILVTALVVFHETGLHRFAVADEAFHPVHTHYVYG